MSTLAVITSFVAGIIGPVAKLIDSLHTSDEEKLLLKAKLIEIEKETIAKAIDFESNLIDAKRDIIVSEAKGDSWIQRSWRPMLMMMITLVVANNFILFPYIELFFPGNAVMLELPSELYNLMSIGVGGYIFGRTGEKIVTKWKENSTE